MSNQESPTSAPYEVAFPKLLPLPFFLGARLEGIFSDSEGGAAVLYPLIPATRASLNPRLGDGEVGGAGVNPSPMALLWPWSLLLRLARN